MMKKLTIEITFAPYDPDTPDDKLDKWLKDHIGDMIDDMIDDMHDDGIGYLPYAGGPWTKTAVSDV